MKDSHKNVSAIHIRVDYILRSLGSARPDVLPPDRFEQNTCSLRYKTIDSINGLSDAVGASATSLGEAIKTNTCSRTFIVRHFKPCSRGSFHLSECSERGFDINGTVSPADCPVKDVAHSLPL
jgi:hypothetical protein